MQIDRFTSSTGRLPRAAGLFIAGCLALPLPVLAAQGSSQTGTDARPQASEQAGEQAGKQAGAQAGTQVVAQASAPTGAGVSPAAATNGARDPVRAAPAARSTGKSTSAGASAGATAGDQRLRPGLWEVSTTSPLLQLAPQISPDRMAQLKRLAGQYGIGMPDISGGAATGRVCVSPAMARRDILPGLEQSHAGCRSHDARRTGSHYQVEVSCSSTDIDGNGSAQGDVTSAETFTGSSRFQGTVKGIPVDEQAQTSGRWIGADCGGVRPVE